MDKKDELRSPTSCLSKAAPDEPIFVLRAKDRLAPQAVRLWAQMAYGAHEAEKVDEAMQLADRMEKWRAQNVPETVAGPGYPVDNLAVAANSRIGLTRY